jgi:hypothetical protein
MASNRTGSSDDRLTHPLLEELGAISAAAEGLFAYSVKIVCGKQTDASVVAAQASGRACTRPRSTSKISIS